MYRTHLTTPDHSSSCSKVAVYRCRCQWPIMGSKQAHNSEAFQIRYSLSTTLYKIQFRWFCINQIHTSCNFVRKMTLRYSEGSIMVDIGYIVRIRI